MEEERAPTQKPATAATRHQPATAATRLHRSHQGLQRAAEKTVAVEEAVVVEKEARATSLQQLQHATSLQQLQRAKTVAEEEAVVVEKEALATKDAAEEEEEDERAATENAATLAQLKSSSAEERPPLSAGESKVDKSLHRVADMLYWLLTCFTGSELSDEPACASIAALADRRH